MAEGHTLICTEKDYYDGLDDRVATNNLEETTLYTFMGLAVGKGAEAISAMVTLESFQHASGYLVLQLCMKDMDLNTAFKVPSRVVAGLWEPDSTKAIHLKKGDTIDALVRRGYFLESENDLDLELLLASSELSILDSIPQ